MGNNPVVMVDPDGEFAFVPILIGAAIGGTLNLGFQAINGKIDNPSDAFKAFGIGALAGGAAVLAPQLIGNIGNIALTQTTASIFTNGAVASGIIPGAVSGAVGGAVGNFGNALAFQNANLKEAGISALWGAASGALVGGTIGYFTGKANGSIWGPNKPTSTIQPGYNPKPNIEIEELRITKFGNNPEVKIDYNQAGQKFDQHAFSNNRFENIGSNSQVKSEVFKTLDQVKPMLREGSNQIVTQMNGQTVTVRAFVQNGVVINVNAFPGTSVRTIGTFIKWK